MKDQLRLILSTIALTVLIWVYADRSGHDGITINVPVTLLPADPGNRMAISVIGSAADEPNVARVEMTLRGPKRVIAQVRAEYERDGLPLTVVIREELPPGPYSRSLFTELSTAPEILQQGLMLQSVSPQTVEFEVDRYKLVPVTVEADAGSYADDLEAPPVIEPVKVTARVLQSKLGDDFTLPPLTLPLEKRIAEALRNQPQGTGGALVFEVPLRSAWPSIEATFSPPTAQVRLRLKRGYAVERIDVRPLGVLIKTQVFFDGYEIIWEDEAATTAQVAYVRVPLSKLDRLRELESGTQAYVIIDDNDLPDGATTLATSRPSTASSGTFRPKPVHFSFPPGFEDVKLDEGRKPTVGLRVQCRNGASDSLLP